VLPGPGRYVATVMPDGVVRVHETEYSALLEEMTLADCRILCHTLQIIEGHWHKFQHRRSIASDRQDEFGLARLEAAILARIIHEKCAIKAKPLISLTTMRMGCLMKFFAMKFLAQVFGGLGRFRAVR